MLPSATRIALVTGANKGIGLEIARQLGRAGLHVILGVRNTELGNAAMSLLQAEGLDVGLVHLDLTDPATIAAAQARISASYGRLDVLVNNAGISDARDGLPMAAAMGAVRRIFDTNFFGTLEVCQAMGPLLMKSESGRVVNVSSGLGSFAINTDPTSVFARFKRIGYNASKAAMNMLTVQLAAELEPAGIKVNAADPGYTATDLNGFRGHQTVAEGATAAVRLALLPHDGPTGGFFDARGVQAW